MSALPQARPGRAFADLSAKEQKATLDKYRDWHVEGSWWGCIYEDANRMAECLGISIDTDKNREPCINFSGFWSQGDGASFVGSYYPKGDAVEAIKTEAPQDEELLRIAKALTEVQVTAKLLGFDGYQAKITRRHSGGNYVHSGMMDVEIETRAIASVIIPDALARQHGQTIQQAMRDFADWIYKCLKEGHDDLTDDETLKEALADYRFDDSGSII